MPAVKPKKKDNLLYLKCIQVYKTTGLQGWVFFVSDIMPS